MKTNFKQNGFTLVELIVVITILAILGTIAFTSLQGYSKDARDATRLSNMKLIETALLLNYQDTNKFPLPSDAINIVYKGATAWNQGDFGEYTRNILGDRNIDIVPLDPLTQSKYSYSITKNKQEYQIGSILEGGKELTNNISNNVFAEGRELGTTKIIGNYNGVFLRVQTGGLDYILSVPSIIASDITDANLVNIVSNNKLTYNGSKNLPSSYLGTGYDIAEGASQLLLNNSFEVFSGSLNQLSTNQEKRGILIQKIQDAYSGTLVIDEFEIGTLLDVPAEGRNINLSTLNNINAALKNEFNINYEFIGDIPNDLNTVPTDLRNIFDENSAYTKGWQSNTCDSTGIAIVEYRVGDTIPATMPTNTIYKIYAGSYALTSSISMNDCTAIIGIGNVDFYNITAGDFDGLTLLNTTNAVVNNINFHDTSSGMFNKGISLSNSNSNTLNNINITDSKQNSIYLSNSNNNIFNNSTAGRSLQSGLYLTSSSNNILSYSNLFSNGGSALQILSNSNNNQINNIRTIDSDEYGIYIYNSDGAIINNLLLYNNSFCGIRTGDGADNFAFSNFQTFNNDCTGNWRVEASANFIFNNGYSYKAGGVGAYFASNTNGILNDIHFYGNSSSTELNLVSGDLNYYGNLNIEMGGTAHAITGGLLNNSLITTLGLKQGIINTSFTYNSTYQTNPNVASWNSSSTGKQSAPDFSGYENYTFGSSLGNQARPMLYNSAASRFEHYGTDGIEYDSTKKIGAW